MIFFDRQRFDNYVYNFFILLRQFLPFLTDVKLIFLTVFIFTSIIIHFRAIKLNSTTILIVSALTKF